MADDLHVVTKVAAMPGKPRRIWRSAGEGPSRLMEPSEHAAEPGGTVKSPRTWLGELALDKCERFAAIRTKARSDQPRCGINPASSR